jgi:hypothetical protein
MIKFFDYMLAIRKTSGVFMKKDFIKIIMRKYSEYKSRKHKEKTAVLKKLFGNESVLNKI